tara:strand:+ start:341 stop:493 length:153 start_codon:yes stop_codon:yes gene_type:complete
MYAHVCIGKLKNKDSERLKKQWRGVAQLGSAGALGALLLPGQKPVKKRNN